MRALTLIIAVALAGPALAGKAKDAESERLLHELDRLAQKGAWSGVERVFRKLRDAGGDLPASAWRTGGDAARQRGNATEAQRRYVKAERLEPESTNEALVQYRTAYGVLEVRRVEATCITLTPADNPFDPSKQAAITWAQDRLAEDGAFRGLVPIGTYTVGGHTVQITAGLKPHRVQRTPGDGDCR